MSAFKRQTKIMQILRECETIQIDELLISFPKISKSTLRRDLKYLESKKLLILFHGGTVILRKDDFEDDFEVKRNQNLEGKQKIAKFAASKINNGDLVYIDSSTTTLEILQFIDKEVTIATNYPNFKKFEPYDFPVIQIGGKISKHAIACFDSIAKENLQHFNFDIAFVGCGGISVEYGISYPSVEQVIYEREIARKSLKHYIVADSNKFNNIFPGKGFDIDECKIITEKLPTKLRKRKNFIVLD